MARGLKRHWPSVVICLALLVCLSILSDAIPLLRGPNPDSDIWHWRYDPNFTSRLFWPILATLLFVMAGWFWVEKSASRLQSAVAMLVIVVAVFLLQVSLIYADEGAVTEPLINRTLALNSGGYFSAAAETDDIGALLRTYPEVMPTFASDHPRTHPPGLLLINWWSIQLAERLPAVAEAGADVVIAKRCTDLWLLPRPAGASAALLFLAYLPLLMASLLLWPAYFLLKQFGGKERAARFGALFAAIAPSLLLFAPISDQLFPTLLIIVLLLVDRGLRRQQWYASVIAGLLLSLLTFQSIGNGIMALFLALYALFRLRQGETSWPQLFRTGAIVASVAMLGWIANYLYARVFPWEIISVGLEQHWELVNSTRIYGRWVLFNLVDLLVYAGLPILFACFLLPGKRWTLPRSNWTALFGATILTILLLNVSGSIRGEVARVWTFLIVFLTLPAGALLAERLDRRYTWAMLGMQLCLVVSLGLAWTHVEPVILVAEPAVVDAVQSKGDESSPSLATFGGLVELVAVGEGELAGGTIPVQYSWRSIEYSRVPYTIFNHLVNESGQLVAQSDGWSVKGSWPTSCWQVGDLVKDQYVIDVPADLPAGNYSLYVGFYDTQLDSRLTLSDGQDSFLVNTIRIPAQ